MNYTQKTILFIAAACINCLSVHAQKVKSGASYAKLVEASKQTFLPGMRGSEPQENLALLIRWDNKQLPETFFWRGEGGWIECAVQRTHKVSNKSPKYEMGETWYETEELKSLSDIKRNDTLKLIPVPGGKYPVPKEITYDMKNRIFFRTAKSGWMYLQVKSFIKRPNVAMP
jgi:hypothetical protein